MYGGKEYPLSAWPAVTLAETEAEGRRTVREFAAPDNFRIYVAASESTWREFTLAELLPESFG